MIVKIKCSKCETDGNLSLADLTYEGPYKCWKCRQYFTIKIENNDIKLFEPITEEEFNQQQELEALKNRFKK